MMTYLEIALVHIVDGRDEVFTPGTHKLPLLFRVREVVFGPGQFLLCLFKLVLEEAHLLQGRECVIVCYRGGSVL